MRRTWLPPLIAMMIVSTLTLWAVPRVQAQTVTSVTVSPAVVPVPSSASRQTSVLVTATVSGLTPGASASCVGTLTEEPSGTAILTSPAVSTSPASSSGTTSVSLQFLVPGLTPAGPAQASVTCGGSTSSAPFRISSVVATSVNPSTIPAGGVATITIMIAAGGTLLPTPCALALTDPSGSAPPLSSQTISIVGGSNNTPASAAVTVTLPLTAGLGTANAAVSCVLPGGISGGDAADFTITDPTVVTILGFTTPAVVGNPLSVTSVTLAGFSCVAIFTPPNGLRISSTPALADATGTAVNVIDVPADLQPGTGALSVTCTDPNNVGNSASSAVQVVTLVSTAALTVSATLTNVVPPLVGGSEVSVMIGTSPGASCALGGLSSAGKRFAITESTANGIVPASGSLTLTFHLPADIPAGTAVVVANCSSGSLSASTQVPVTVGAEQGVTNCDGTAAPAATQPTPIANTGTAYSGTAGEPTQFSGSGSAPSAGAVITSCVWTFGDGSRATSLNPSHLYAAPGTYTATLQITDSAGLSATATAIATIAPFIAQCSTPALTGTSAVGPCLAGPVCPDVSLPGACLPQCATLTTPAVCPQPGTSIKVLMGGPYSGAVSQTISFHASTSVSATRRVCTADTTLGTGGPACSIVPSDDLPAPIGYLWDFGDGTQATGDTLGHAYGQAGTYTVTVFVYFDDGSSASAATVATVGQPS